MSFFVFLLIITLPIYYVWVFVGLTSGTYTTRNAFYLSLIPFYDTIKNIIKGYKQLL